MTRSNHYNWYMACSFVFLAYCSSSYLQMAFEYRKLWCSELFTWLFYPVLPFSASKIWYLSFRLALWNRSYFMIFNHWINKEFYIFLCFGHKTSVVKIDGLEKFDAYFVYDSFNKTGWFIGKDNKKSNYYYLVKMYCLFSLHGYNCTKLRTTQSPTPALRKFILLIKPSERLSKWSSSGFLCFFVYCVGLSYSLWLNSQNRVCRAVFKALEINLYYLSKHLHHTKHFLKAQFQMVYFIFLRLHNFQKRRAIVWRQAKFLKNS